jgi:hypothetical protein
LHPNLPSYIARPPIAHERLKLSDCGQVVYELKTPYRDGTTHVVMSPLEWMHRLAALIPRPRLHLVRYHGILAPNAKWRAQVVPRPKETDIAELPESHEPTRSYIPWPLTHIHVLHGTWTSCPAGAPAQARVRAGPGALPGLQRPAEVQPLLRIPAPAAFVHPCTSSPRSTKRR